MISTEKNLTEQEMTSFVNQVQQIHERIIVKRMDMNLFVYFDDIATSNTILHTRHTKEVSHYEFTVFWNNPHKRKGFTYYSGVFINNKKSVYKLIQKIKREVQFFIDKENKLQKEQDEHDKMLALAELRDLGINSYIFKNFDHKAFGMELDRTTCSGSSSITTHVRYYKFIDSKYLDFEIAMCTEASQNSVGGVSYLYHFIIYKQDHTKLAGSIPFRHISSMIMVLSGYIEQFITDK